MKTPARIKERPSASALHLAAQGGHSKICDLLLETKQLTVDDTDLNLMTPLHYAAMHSHYEVARVLVQNDANCLFKDKLNVLPLHMAAKSGDLSVFKFIFMSTDR